MIDIVSHEEPAKISTRLDVAQQIQRLHDPNDTLQDLISPLLACRKLLSEETSNHNFRDYWQSSYIQLCDQPLGWIDYCPFDKTIVLGADSQVWEHVEKCINTWPSKYQWIALPWLGEFHKLKNHHLKLKKRYAEFHLEEHVRHYLDDPTKSKLQKFL